MDKISPRVVAKIDLLRAQAADGLARVEAQLRTTPVVKTSETRRLALMKSITELQAQVLSWELVYAAAKIADGSRFTMEEAEAADDVDAEKEFPA